MRVGDTKRRDLCRSHRGLLALAAAALSIGGCEADRPTADPSSESGATLAAARGPGFAIRVSGPPSLRLATSSSIEVALDPVGSWHLSEEFPSSLELEVPAGLAATPATQGREHALRHDEQGSRFVIQVTATRAGRETLKAHLRFGLCRDELCTPTTRELDIPLSTKEAVAR